MSEGLNIISRYDAYQRFVGLLRDGVQYDYYQGDQSFAERASSNYQLNATISRTLRLEINGEVIFNLDFTSGHGIAPNSLEVSGMVNGIPRTLDDIVTLYNQAGILYNDLHPSEPIELIGTEQSDIEQRERTYYYAINNNYGYNIERVSELARLNPQRNIRMHTFSPSFTCALGGTSSQTILISDLPLTELKLPQNFGKPTAITEREFDQITSRSTLNYNIGESQAQTIWDEISRANNGSITPLYFEDENRLQLSGDTPPDSIKLPEGTYRNIGIDEDGYIGFIERPIMEYTFDEQGRGERNILRYFHRLSITNPELIQPEEYIKPNVEDTTVPHNQDQDPVTPENENIGRQFEIYEIRRLNNQRRENIAASTDSALSAGACALGAAISAYLNGATIEGLRQAVEGQLTTWQGVIQSASNVANEIGPLSTVLTVAAAGLLTRAGRYSRAAMRDTRALAAEARRQAGIESRRAGGRR